MLSEPNEFVLDPYCGSGTVLVEAALADRRALGIDLNPLAVLIAQTKITPVSRRSLSALRQTMTEITATARPRFAGGSLSPLSVYYPLSGSGDAQILAKYLK